jgi:hypothetical protein
VSRNRPQGNGSAWEETQGIVEREAGNQRELVRPREPGSLACNETACSQAGKQAARQTHSGRQAGRGHWDRQAKPEVNLLDDCCV